jgi:pSer/pThr/pTyr-binding forkhead associated (FHA) protein
MHHPRALCKVIAGPNAGDVIALEVNACRLIGRHLSEHETSFIDRDGNRMLDAQAHALLGEQLGEHLRHDTAQGAPGQPAVAPPLGSFERGPDVIFADDAISRAHAMLFYDPQGVGIVDLASTNGTYVNTRRVSLSMLRDGDVIALGSSEISIHVRNP